MRRVLAAAPIAALAAAVLAAPPSRAAEPEVEKTTVHIDTTVGPDDATHCDVVADLYKPSTATAATPAPVILTTNGFGGSKDDQAGTGTAFAKRGYVVLSYSGLGFGGSGCNITLDDRDWDGKAAQDLVTWLAALDYVLKDAPGDPRLGMIGGSYGGQVQYAAAAIDKRIDTLVPLITWNDLAYSLAPNNLALGAQPDGVPPGVPKHQWTEAFFALGSAQPLMHPDTTPVPPSTCPGFHPKVCPANATTGALGYPTRDTIDFLRHASVGTFLDDIDVPVLIAQGQQDTLFNLNEAVATYLGLKARDVPVKLMFHSWGHSGPAAPGELDLANPDESHQGRVFAAWFDKWLKGLDVDTGPEFEFFRPWVSYTGIATPAYGSAPRYPLKDTLPLRLSGTDELVGPTTPVTAGSATFLSPPGGQPASYSETSAVGGTDPVSRVEPYDVPGQFAAFTTPALKTDVDVVGVPTLDVRLSAPASVGADPATMPTVFAKLYDVAPDGTQQLIRRLVAPARIGSTADRLRIHLAGIVHRFPAGHRLRLVLASTDQAYLGSRVPHVLTVVNDPAAPNVLTLPVTSKAARDAVPRVLGERRSGGSGGTGSGGSGSGGTAADGAAPLAATGASGALPAAAAGLLVLAAYARRRVLA
jgi:ABC-2 type transport system ATP-binding protein